MKRRLAIVAVFLLAGAAVNVAVAWGWAWSSPQGLTQHGATWLDDTWIWRVQTDPGPGHGRISWIVQSFPEAQRGAFTLLFGTRQAPGPEASTPAESVIPRWSKLQNPTPVDVAGREVPGVLGGPEQHAFGWPWLSLTYTRVLGDVQGGIVLKPHRVLPLAPLWLGMLANTILYASGLWLAWFVKALRPFTLLRRWRVRRGLCPACAYPMGTTDVCTECGATLPARARPAT